MTTMKKCPFCAEEILSEALKCKHCHEILDEEMRRQSKEENGTKSQPNPGTAAVLSLVIPGAGQMYRGRVGEGLAWLFFIALGYAFLIFPGVILHICCIINAYKGNQKIQKKPKAKPLPQPVWTIYAGLFIFGTFLGFLASMFAIELTKPPVVVVFILLFAPMILLPFGWYLIRLYKVRTGKINDGMKRTMTT